MKVLKVCKNCVSKIGFNPELCERCIISLPDFEKIMKEVKKMDIDKSIVLMEIKDELKRIANSLQHIRENELCVDVASFDFEEGLAKCISKYLEE